MRRPLRIELAGGFYHVTSRGDRCEAIYRDDQDRSDWLTLLGSEAFVERHSVAPSPVEQLREVPRAQRRVLAKPLAEFSHGHPVRVEAMARAFQTGVYTMQEIADYFGVHHSTVSRAVHRFERGS